MRDRIRAIKRIVAMRNAFFAAIAMGIAMLLSPLALAPVPALAQTQTVVIDCLPPWETNNRFLESTRIKHPGLSLNGFDCGNNCDIGYGLKQVLEKAYNNKDNQNTRIKNVFQKIIKKANEPISSSRSFGDISSNIVRLQSKGFVALAAYVLENNDYDPTTLNPSLPSASVAVNSFRKTLLDTTIWKFNTDNKNDGKDDGVKWAMPLSNMARTIDLYLALENAYKHYDAKEYAKKNSRNVISKVEKNNLMNKYTNSIITLELLRNVKEFIFTFDRYNKEPGNAPLVMQIAIGYAMLTRQHGDYSWIRSSSPIIPITYDDLLSYRKRAFKAAGAKAGTDRHKHWNYQIDDGKHFWAEGPYYFQLALGQVIPFWHAVRINKLLSYTNVHDYTFFDPFYSDRFTRPLHWLADISTPDGKTPPLDDGNKRIIYNVGVLDWNSTYGNSSVGEKFAWIGSKINSASFRSDLYPIEIAIPHADVPTQNPLDALVGNSYANKTSGDAGNKHAILSNYGRQEVVVRRDIAGHTHYILLNGESGDAILRGEGHEQGDQLQLLYYIDETSYLVDSGYDKGDGKYNSSWNRYNDHNVMTLDPNDPKYSSADGGVRSPIIFNVKFRKKSEHQNVNEIYGKSYGNIDLLSAKMKLHASPKTAFKPFPGIYYKDFADYYRNVLFIQDPNQPYIVDINAVSSHKYNDKNKYAMLYYGNSEDTKIFPTDGYYLDSFLWENIYESNIILQSDKTLKSSKTNKKLYIQPFIVEINQNHAQISDHKIRESYIETDKGKGIPVKRLRLPGTGSRENFTTVAFISAFPKGGDLRFRAAAKRSVSGITDMDWQYFTRPNSDTTIVDVVVARSAKEYATAASGNMLYFPIAEANSFYVELANPLNYGFIRLIKKNNIWDIDPSFRLNLQRSTPGVRVFGLSCIRENTDGHFRPFVLGGKPPYSYSWSVYRICPKQNSDAISSSSVYPCNTWINIGYTRVVSFGKYGEKFGFKLRVKVTDSSLPQQSSVSKPFQVKILSSTDDKCPINITEGIAGKTETESQESLLLATSLSEVNESIPETYALHQNFPNPFNPSTEILFDLPETAMVSLVLYDVLGREIARLVEGEMPAGWHRARFNAANLPSGVYLYRIQAGDFMDTGRMTLIK